MIAFYASMAKAFAGQTAVNNAQMCVQVFGGAGYNTEMPAEKLMRDSLIFGICTPICLVLHLVADFCR